MRTIIACVLSGMCASLLTVWMVSPHGSPVENRLQAQDLLPPPSILTEDETTPDADEAVAKTEPEEPALQLTDEEAISTRVYRVAQRCVVNITSTARRFDPFSVRPEDRESSGSGTIIDDNGHIVTNFHVIEDADELEVTLFDGSSYGAEIVGGDPLNDLAVLRIDAPAEKLYPVILADSDRLLVGMRVFAIGNPFGLQRTMTTGIISSLNRMLPVRNHRSIRSIIQIDAAVNPGNSGGPLLDTRGRLIGINVAIATKTGQSAGVGFAIPVNLVARVAGELIKHGRFIRPDIGLRRVLETERGLMIEELDPDGPASRAGLRAPMIERRRRGPFVVLHRNRKTADLIVGVDKLRTNTADDFLTYIESKQPGDSVTVVIERDGELLKVPVTLVAGE